MQIISPDSEARSLFDQFLAEVDLGCSTSRPARDVTSLSKVLASDRAVQMGFLSLALEWKPGLDQGPTWRQIANQDTHRLELLGEVIGEMLRTVDDVPLALLIRHLAEVEPVLDPVVEGAKQAKMAAQFGLPQIEVPGVDPDRKAAIDRANRVDAAIDQQALFVDSVLAAVAASANRSDPELRSALVALRERFAALEVLGEPDHDVWIASLDTLLA